MFVGDLIMAGGWTRDGGVQDQIDTNVDDAVIIAFQIIVTPNGRRVGKRSLKNFGKK